MDAPNPSSQVTYANRTPLRIGSVGLKARDLSRLTDFYHQAIGLQLIDRDSKSARLGAGGVTLLALESAPSATPDDPRTAGLYHTAFLQPTRQDLGRWLVHAARNRVQLSGASDHLVSEAIYLDDPEGNGIEVYADRDPALWQWSAGTVTMGTDQLDIDDLVSLTNTRVSDYAKAPDGMRIGHMHLRVGDLAEANGFYRAGIGFDPTRERQGAAFLSSGRYHHHLGLNVWQSAGAGRRDDAATGLAWFSLEIEKPDLFAAQEERLRKAGAQIAAVPGGIEVGDPWGTRVRLIKI